MGYSLSDNIKIIIGKNLKKIREKRGWTQVEAAIKADIHPNYYPRIERGEVNITLENLYKLIKTLKIKSSDILPF